MTITNRHIPQASTYRPSRNVQPAKGPSFDRYTDVGARKQQRQAMPKEEGMLSAAMQFYKDYDAWKAQQPNLALPESQGWTEENLAFLRDHYSGDLSAFEVFDVLETMETMGAISRKAADVAEGIHKVVFDLKDCGTMFSSDVDLNSKNVWLRSFGEAPMLDFHSLDDIFSWAEQYQSEDYPDFITSAEMFARGWL